MDEPHFERGSIRGKRVSIRGWNQPDRHSTISFGWGSKREDKDEEMILTWFIERRSSVKGDGEVNTSRRTC